MDKNLKIYFRKTSASSNTMAIPTIQSPTLNT